MDQNKQGIQNQPTAPVAAAAPVVEPVVAAPVVASSAAVNEPNVAIETARAAGVTAIQEPVAAPVAQEPVAAAPVAHGSVAAEMEALMAEEPEPVPVSEPAPEPADDVVFTSKPKGKINSMMIGLIAAILVALGGVVFGVIMMMNGNSQAEIYKKQIADLQATINSTSEAENPVIASAELDQTYGIDFNAPLVNGEGSLILDMTDGKIDLCQILLAESEPINCSINGISSEIYKIVLIGEGQDISNSSVGFILTDGTVAYVPVADFSNSNSFEAKVLDLDGFVVDAVEIEVRENLTAYASTVFVFNDGSFVKYDSSMLTTANTDTDTDADADMDADTDTDTDTDE